MSLVRYLPDWNKRVAANCRMFMPAEAFLQFFQYLHHAVAAWIDLSDYF